MAKQYSREQVKARLKAVTDAVGLSSSPAPAPAFPGNSPSRAELI